ncbi:MAG TPA: TonB family protein [Selenomonadales bacterium]|nr:TonB family protein [Selenomonadales bacterium]
MTYHLSWYRAFGFSCAAHLAFILLLAAVLEIAVDFRPVPQPYIVIELTEAAAGNVLRDGGPAAAETVPVSASVPAENGPVSRPGPRPAVSSPAGPGVEQAASNGNGAAASALPAGSGGAAFAVQPGGGSGPAATGGGDLDGIIEAFLRQIEKRKDYPYMARRRGQEGRVIVTVRLTAAGELAGEQIVRSSGVAALDEAALLLVRKVCPFPHNAGRPITMNIPIAYRLEE